MIPKLIFIVPYRDRETHKNFFINHMKTVVMKDRDDYEMYFVHQVDSRPFNRGAMKNIGFLAIKKKYPEHYKDITIVFNDVDTLPFTKDQLPYETRLGVIKHFYGFEYALGGIISITGSDYESINGFPNFWAWGFEDNALQTRAIKNGIRVDRSTFYQIMDMNIIHFCHGYDRNVSRSENIRHIQETREGINSIFNLEYNIDGYYINVKNFSTPYEPGVQKNWSLRNGNKPFPNLKKPSMTMKLMIR